jgi:uncharacterized protein YhaN
MMAKAIQNNWPLTDEHRKAIVQVLLRITLDPESSRRERTSAAKALMAADKLNLEAAALEIRVPNSITIGEKMQDWIESLESLSDSDIMELLQQLPPEDQKATLMELASFRGGPGGDGSS